MASAWARSLETLLAARLRARVARPKPKRRPPCAPSGEPDGAPVDPRRPSTLDGGAAAALEFDD